MSHVGYRADIDGLRAFAVLSVILFHLDFDFIKGGFVGVDVFFVISGFLITRLVHDEVLRTGTFNFPNFYIRRIRRLFPALFTTLCFTFVFAFLLFSTSNFARFGGTLIHALTSMSNIFFWLEADYFDAASTVKPLLHTWSLSIEEQFYLVWPLMSVLMFKLAYKNKFSNLFVLFILASIAAVSLYINNMFSEYPATLFYLLPFRVYEFAIGGAMIFIVDYQIKNKIIHEMLFLTGCLMIAYSCLTFTGDILFPSYWGLIPCIGTALAIYSGHQARYLGKLFNNPVAVGIGLISYSLYLIHWPIIVFWQYFTFKSISVVEAFAIVIISIIVAMAMYRYIETPFRAKRNGITIGGLGTGLATLLACAVLIILSANVWESNGWAWRVNEVIAQELRPPIWPETFPEELHKRTQWTRVSEFGQRNEETKKVLVIGDSHALQFIWGAKYLASKYNLSFQFYTYIGCTPIFGTYKIYEPPGGIENETRRQKGCRQQIILWEQHVQDNQFDYVILSARWNWLFEPIEYYDTVQPRHFLVDRENPQFDIENSRQVFSSFLGSTIKTIHHTGATAIIFGQVPHAGKDLDGCNNVPKYLFSMEDIHNRCNYVPKNYVLERSAFSNDTIRKASLANNAIDVIATDYFCGEDDEYCTFIYKNTRLKNDDDHVNRFGSVYLMQRWEESANFPFK